MSCRETSKKTSKLKIMQLFRIVKKEPIHLLWLLSTIFFGFMGVFINITIYGLDAAFEMIVNNGDLNISSVGILAPFIFDMFYKVYDDRKNKRDVHFVKIRLILTIFSLILCIFSTLLSIGVYKKKFVLQIILALILILLSFTCYLVQYLDPKENKDLDDITIEDEQQKRVSEIISYSNKSNEIDLGNGKAKL